MGISGGGVGAVSSLGGAIGGGILLEPKDVPLLISVGGSLGVAGAFVNNVPINIVGLSLGVSASPIWIFAPTENESIHTGFGLYIGSGISLSFVATLTGFSFGYGGGLGYVHRNFFISAGYIGSVSITPISGLHTPGGGATVGYRFRSI